MSSDDKKPMVELEERDEGFVSRWSRRKTASHVPPEPVAPQATTPTPSPPQAEADTAPPTDADMPPLDSLGVDSDYSGFMSTKVSEELRSLALRKLFHLPQFNVTDGLNDYDEDYTRFDKLGNVLTHEMRRLLELEKNRQAAADEKQARQGDQITAQSGVSAASQAEQSGNPGADKEPGQSFESGTDASTNLRSDVATNDNDH